MKNFVKTNKGITLIALVITIIVLLILAGVALNLTIGENGIFSRAQDAVNTWKNAETNEQLAMQEFSDMIDEILNGPKPEEGTLAAMYVQAVEVGCTNADGTCDNPNHLHIGDYVDFANPESGEATALATETGWASNQHYTVNSETNQLNWRVLGYDAEKMQVKLIAATPLKDDNDDYLVMYGAQSYVTGYLVPDKISEKIYENLPNVAEARSVKMEDINELLGIEENEIANMNAFPFMNEGATNYGDDIKIEGAYTPEEYLEKGSPDSGLGSGIDTKTDGYAFIVSTEDMEGVPAPIVKMENTRIYDMIFNDTEYGSGGAYWLSSRGVYAYSGDAYYGPGAVVIKRGLCFAESGFSMFGSDSGGVAYKRGDGFGVRPVVALESGVKASDVPKIADQTNQPWGGSGGGEN